MTEFHISLIGLLFLCLLLLIGVPVAFSMFLVGFFGLVFIQGFDATIVLVASTSYHAIANWLYIVIPMFILMGEFASESGIVADLFRFFRAWTGRAPGSLGIVTILTSTLFAFATGSSLAATAVISKLALPEMEKSNYQQKLSLGCVAAGGTLGNLIPPSISLIIFGIITDVPIRKLLIGGIIPGFLAALMFIFWITLTAILNPNSAPRTAPSTWKEKLLSLKNVWGMLVLFLGIFGSIYTGIATVSEAATVGGFTTFLIALLMQKLTLVKFQNSLLKTGLVTSMVFLLLVGVTVFSRFLIFSGFTNELVRFTTEAAISPLLIVVGILFTFLVLGCFVDPASMILLAVPVFFPIVVHLGIHPVWFGVISVVMTQIGFLTPPVGMCVYVLQGASGRPLEECFASAINPLICWGVVVILLVAFPSIVTWLPDMM